MSYIISPTLCTPFFLPYCTTGATAPQHYKYVLYYCTGNLYCCFKFKYRRLAGTCILYAIWLYLVLYEYLYYYYCKLPGSMKYEIYCMSTGYRVLYEYRYIHTNMKFIVLIPGTGLSVVPCNLPGTVSYKYWYWYRVTYSLQLTVLCQYQ